MHDTAPKKGIIRRLYDWTLHWAATPYGFAALVVISFIESSFFPIPPDVLLIALCFSNPKLWAKYAFWCTVASVAGGVLGWYIGWGLWEVLGEPIVGIYDPERVAWAKVETWYAQYGFLGVLIAAITPIPYKVFTIASGVLHFNLGLLILASILGRGFRFFLVAGLIRAFGTIIKPFLEKYLEICLIIFTVLGVLGFVCLKFL